MERRAKSVEQALSALMKLCAKGEKSTGDALRLMRTWGVEESEQKNVLDRLVAERFIDNERFAGAFVRDKLNFSGWGAAKIRSGLYAKGVEREVIERAMAECYDVERGGERLEQMLVRKVASTKAATGYELKGKLLRFGLSRGFAYEQVLQAVESVVGNEDEF